jgi:hypothetical protein
MINNKEGEIIKIAGDADIGFRYRGLYWEDYI